MVRPELGFVYSLVFDWFPCLVDALRACTNHNLPRDESVSISMPLYKNLVALERAHNRLDSAKGICGRLLKDNSSNVELWQCRAALDQAQGCMEGAKKAYDKGLSKCRGHAALVYSAARFYLEKVCIAEDLERQKPENMLESKI